MSSLLTKITSTATNAYQEAEKSLLAGKAGRAARAVKATAYSVSAICQSVWQNLSKDNVRRLAKEAVEPLCQGIPADCILITGKLASPWGYIPAILTGGFFMHIKSLVKFNASFQSDFVNTETGKSLLQATTLAMPPGPVYGPLLYTLCVFYPDRTGVSHKNSDSFLKWRSSFKAPQIVLGSACVCLLGGAPGITTSRLIYKTLSSTMTYFQSIFESNYALVEKQLFVKHIEGKKGSAAIMKIVMQYLDGPSRKKQRGEAVVAFYEDHLSSSGSQHASSKNRLE